MIVGKVRGEEWELRDTPAVMVAPLAVVSREKEHAESQRLRRCDEPKWTARRVLGRARAPTTSVHHRELVGLEMGEAALYRWEDAAGLDAPLHSNDDATCLGVRTGKGI